MTEITNTSNHQNLEAGIEAVLFASGVPVINSTFIGSIKRANKGS